MPETIAGLSPAQMSPDTPPKESESPAEAQRPRSPLLFWRRGRSPLEAGREGEQSTEQKKRREQRRSKLLERATERGNTKQRPSEPSEPNDIQVVPMDKLPEEAVPAPVGSTIVPSLFKGSLPAPRSEEREEIEKLTEEVEQLREEKEELADDKLTLFQSLSDMRAQLDQQATNTAVLKAQLGQAQSELNETHDKLKQEQDATESDKTRALQRQIDSLTQEKDAALLDVKTLQEVQLRSLKLITEIEGKVAKEQEKSKRDMAEIASALMTVRQEAAGNQKQLSILEAQLQAAMEENEALAQRKRFGCF